MADELYDLFKERAEEGDGQYAIAYALLKVAFQLKYLGVGDAATTMGAIEFLAVETKNAGAAIAEAIRTKGEDG